jgi:hypothetical protein
VVVVMMMAVMPMMMIMVMAMVVMAPMMMVVMRHDHRLGGRSVRLRGVVGDGRRNGKRHRQRRSGGENKLSHYR